MSRPALTCGRDETLNAAAQLMWAHDCGSVPITDADGRLIGIVTDRDIWMATATRGCLPHAILVSDIMSRKVFTLIGRDSVDTAARLMADARVRRVLVIDAETRPIGFLSLGDIARHTAKSLRRNTSERAALESWAPAGSTRPARPL